MFENKYDSETNTKETEYVPVQEPEIKEPVKKNGGFKKVIKAVAGICCAAAISVGSIAGYKYFTDDEHEQRTTVADTDTNTKDNETKPAVSSDNLFTSTADADNDDYSMSSLLQISKGGDTLSTQDIYKKVLPSVVGVTSKFSVEVASSNPYEGFFGYYFGDQGGTTTKEAVGTGTGIIMSSDGYIITNAHVIYESDYRTKASEVSVRLYDETEYPAEIVAYDVQTDIAVLKVNDASDLKAAEFGDSGSLNVGDAAIAIGNPLGFDLFGTLTVGYISGLNREIAMDDTVMHLIQTDAAINSGNSGGPLINDKGQVIGINSMKLSNSYSSSSATIEGLGFAIPINEAQVIVNELINNGYVTGRPQLGITCQNASVSQYSPVAGIYIAGVNEGGAAEEAGLKTGDIIVGADGQAVSTIEELNQIKNKFNAGDTLRLTIVREKRYYDMNVVLEETSKSEES